MEEMSIDFDIDDDLIKKFLLHKLAEIQLGNSELEKQISRRKELLNGCVEKMASKFSQNILEITDTWQRNLNGKWIIGIEVKNTHNTGLPNNINVVLKWNSSTPLTYNTKTFCRYKHPEQYETALPEKLEEIVKSLEQTDDKKIYVLEDEWISMDEVKENLSIILAFEIPQFVEQSTYNISGILSYQFKEKFCQLNIPNFVITARDVTNRLFVVSGVDLISGGKEAYLSNLIANEESELVVKVTKTSYTSLENILEFDLKFKKVHLISKTNSFFYLDPLGSSTDGYFLKLKKESETVYNLNIFSRNQTSLHLLLHCLYQNIPDIVILPKAYKENLLEVPPCAESFTQHQSVKKAAAMKSTLNEFGKSLESQISLGGTFFTERLDNISEEIIADKDEVDLNVNIQDYKRFKKELSDLELHSDLLYAKIQKFTTESEPASEVDME